MFEIDGTISGYDIHPSGDYVIVTSEQGFYYIFRIETGEVRGKVAIAKGSGSPSIDPSGLYLAVSVGASGPNQEPIEMRNVLEEEGTRPKLTRIVFYEIGTGMQAAEISSLFSVRVFSFSPNGKFFVAGSETGCVSIWALTENMNGNIARVLAQIEIKPDFWSAYPIFIKNEYIEELNRFNKESKELDQSQMEEQSPVIQDLRPMRMHPYDTEIVDGPNEETEEILEEEEGPEED